MAACEANVGTARQMGASWLASWRASWLAMVKAAMMKEARVAVTAALVAAATVM